MIANIVRQKIALMREQGIGIFHNSSRPVECIAEMPSDHRVSASDSNDLSTGNLTTKVRQALQNAKENG